MSLNKSTLFSKLKTKLFMAGTLLICRMFVIVYFLTLQRLVTVFKALFMARP